MSKSNCVAFDSFLIGDPCPPALLSSISLLLSPNPTAERATKTTYQPQTRMTPLSIFRFFLNTLILTTFLLFFPPFFLTSKLTSTSATPSTSTNLLSSPSGHTVYSPNVAWRNPARPPQLHPDSEDLWIACDTTDKSPLESAIEATAAKISDGSSCSQRNMGGSKCTMLASHDGAKISICGKYLGLMSCRHVRVIVEVVKVQCSRDWPRRSDEKFGINGVRVVLHS